MPIEITDSTRFVINKQLSSSEIGGEAVVLNLKDGNFYGLNPVAAEVWKWLAEPRTLAELVGLVTGEFNVEAATAEADLRKLLADLDQRKLISVCP